MIPFVLFFFFNDTATTEIYTLSLHDALPICDFVVTWSSNNQDGGGWGVFGRRYSATGAPQGSEFLINTTTAGNQQDRKSTRLNSSHANISYAVFCLKKKKKSNTS